MFALHYGKKKGEEGYDNKYDLDGSQVINRDDLAIFIKAFGPCPA
jgi:hypothetical protein